MTGENDPGRVHAVNFGRVVGMTDHLFDVLYEDGFKEALPCAR